MTDAHLADDLSLIESLSKLFALLLGSLYLLGFLVVASHLSRYGVSSFSVLHLQYLIAGAWVLVPLMVLAVVNLLPRRFDERVAPAIPGKFNWRGLVISLFFTGIPFLLFMLILNAALSSVGALTWGILIRPYLFYVVTSNLAQMFWMSWRTETGKETRWMNRSHAAPFYLAFLLVVMLGYTVWFSARIYPLIPFSLGGGRPLTVVFVEGDKKMPEEIQRTEGSIKRSIPYKLLLSTDRYYVVVAPSPKERSLEVSRDSVAGMVVLE
jgi:hypothetical protein